MLQKVGHAAQGEGNCRAGGTRCCSERKLQAVQRFLPGYDIIASRLDFSVWKRMKNLAGNRQPLIYGAFPVWRNCTVRAHINNDRYQWALAKLSPNEYYQYLTTGSYPC